MKCKLLAIFIIALVLLSLTSSRRVRRVKQVKGVSTVTRFGLGMVTALNGGDGKGLNFCLPESWKSGTLANDMTSINSYDLFVSTLGYMENIIKGLKLVIVNACYYFKGFVKSFMQSIFVGKRRRRMYIQIMKSKKYPGESYFQSAKEFIKNTVEKIKTYLKSPGFTALKDSLIKCGPMVLTLKTNVTSIVKATGAILQSGGMALAPMLTTAICGWEEFIKAYDYLKAAVGAVGHERWFQIGKFLGQLLVIMGKEGAMEGRRR